MVAVTYGIAYVATAEPAAQAGCANSALPVKSWFARFMDALAVARMEQAGREFKMHKALLPYTLDERGNRLVHAGSVGMPFGGW
jgi:hypothetical protein